jgi:hypothetical protein
MTSQSASASKDASFNNLESVVLNAIASPYPTQRAELLAQFRSARVIGRRNSGVGFFTDFEVEQQKADPVTVPRVIGNVWAHIKALSRP